MVERDQYAHGKERLIWGGISKNAVKCFGIDEESQLVK